jgi:hypothetical protein
VAILGSLLAASYSAHLGDAADALPAAARAEARTSIVATLEAVRAVQGDAEAAAAVTGVPDAAEDAFVSAMHVTALGTATATLVATVVVFTWLPGRRTRPTTPS